MQKSIASLNSRVFADMLNQHFIAGWHVVPGTLVSHPTEGFVVVLEDPSAKISKTAVREARRKLGQS